jgi:hypothetical protein
MYFLFSFVKIEIYLLKKTTVFIYVKSKTINYLPFFFIT